MNKKTEMIAWFYPTWSVFVLLFVMVALISVGANTFQVVVPILILLFAELPVLLYKKAIITRVVAESDWFVIYAFGVLVTALIYLAHVPMTEFLNDLLVVGLVVAIFVYTKMVALASYNKLGE